MQQPIAAKDAAVARILAVAGLAALACAAILIGVLHLLPETVAISAVRQKVLHLLPETVAISAVRQTISEYVLTGVGWMFNAGLIATAVASLLVFFALLLTRQATWRSIGLVFGGLWVAGLLVIEAFPEHNWAIGPSANGQIHRIASVVAFLSLPPLGLIERGMVITEVAAIVALALWALAATRRPPRVPHLPDSAERSADLSTVPSAGWSQRREPADLSPRRPAG